jgi:hypothetical protein
MTIHTMFTISDKEVKKIRHWLKNHNCTQSPAVLSYDFYPKKMKMVLHVECICGKKLMLK